MILTRAQVARWSIAGATTILGALLAAGAAEAWGLPARVTTLEANDKSNHELLLELRDDLRDVRQDLKELMLRP